MPKVEIRATENGPYEVVVDGKVIAELCRCGASTNKPYCSGMHEEIGFVAPKAVIKVVE